VDWNPTSNELIKLPVIVKLRVVFEIWHGFWWLSWFWWFGVRLYDSDDLCGLAWMWRTFVIFVIWCGFLWYYWFVWFGVVFCDSGDLAYTCFISIDFHDLVLSLVALVILVIRHRVTKINTKSWKSIEIKHVYAKSPESQKTTPNHTNQ
jgi:hypothetical protein